MAEFHEESGLLIPGIDGETPLGFLAGLGLLQVVSDTFERGRVSSVGDRPRLAWRQADAIRPVLFGTASLELLAELILEDSRYWGDSAVLRFRYVKQEKQGPKPVGGLSAPLAVVRAWQRDRREAEDEASLFYGAALFCEDLTEVNGTPASADDHAAQEVPIDPDVALELTVAKTFFDFTARRAQFLEQAEAIRAYLNMEIISDALRTGAVDYNAPRTLDWDPSADTPGAIYTGFRRGYLPVHEWLGFRALKLFPIAKAGTRVRMTACSGRRLDGEFTWPIWERPASLDVVRSLVSYPNLAGLGLEQRRALGLSGLLRAELTKKADGYTGTFAPSRPI